VAFEDFAGASDASVYPAGDLSDDRPGHSKIDPTETADHRGSGGPEPLEAAPRFAAAWSTMPIAAQIPK
jgi:hypothetical protein